VFSKRNYLNTIYERIKTDIAPYDPDGILNPIWVNSRGAIPRFDRGSIEIRIMDIQECPSADMAILGLVIETIKALVGGKFVDFESQMKWKTDLLAQLLSKTSEKAQDVVVDHREFLDVFGFPESSATMVELWRHITERLVRSGNVAVATGRREVDVLLTEGTLSQRIVKALGKDHSKENITAVYKRIADCLAQNKMFLV
jgi:carboxylate-amine ligase